MRPAWVRWGTIGTALAVAIVGAGASAVLASSGPGPKVNLSPERQRVALAETPVTATYALSVGSRANWSGAATLSVVGQPAGSTVTFSPPSPVTVPAPQPASGPVTGTMTVTLPPTTALGTYRITVIASAPGARSGSDQVRLDVEAPPALFVEATPGAASVHQGDRARFDVSITRVSLTAPVTLAVSGLPPGTTATFSDNPLNGRDTRSRLRVQTSGATPSGTFPLTITASGGTLSASVVVSLGVSELGSLLLVSGDVPTPLERDQPVPLNLQLTNTSDRRMRITGLTVVMTNISDPIGCPPGPPNFALESLDLTGLPPLVLRRGRTATLQQLGVPVSHLPTVTFTESGQDQTACTGTTFTLAYSATATGAHDDDHD